jgi:hypothetical protein
MGAIARNIANKITTSGVFTSGAIANSSVTGITVLANASDGITLISSQTASNSASVSFTTGISSTYNFYKFVFVAIRPTTDSTTFQWNASIDSGSNYNVAKTNDCFKSSHNEADTATGLEITGNGEQLNSSTGYASLHQINDLGNDADQNVSGSLILFNPSGTSLRKHYLAVSSSAHPADYILNNFISGSLDTTSAVNAVRFQMASGNFYGTVYMYGFK